MYGTPGLSDFRPHHFDYLFKKSIEMCIYSSLAKFITFQTFTTGSSRAIHNACWRVTDPHDSPVAGWHIPSQTEFQTLNTEVINDGNALKAVGQGGTNTSGFSVLLSGYRYTMDYSIVLIALLASGVLLNSM